MIFSAPALVAQYLLLATMNNFDFDVLVEIFLIKDKFHGLVRPPAGFFENKT